MTQPIRKYRAGQMSLTVWKQETEKEGKKQEFLTYSFQKMYKDGEEWKKSKSLTAQDLNKAAALFAKASQEESVKSE